MAPFSVHSLSRPQKAARHANAVWRRHKRLAIETLENRLALSATAAAVGPLLFSPRAIVEANPGAVPPVAVVAFDPQPLLANLIATGAASLTASGTFPLEGTLSETVKIGPASTGPTPAASANAALETATLTVSYNLTAQVNQSIIAPVSTGTGSPTITPGSLNATFSIWGTITGVLTVNNPAPKETLTFNFTEVSVSTTPYESGKISGTIYTIAPGGSQAISFTTQENVNENVTGTLVQKLPGLNSVEAVTLVRGVVQDHSLSNWLQTLHAVPTSATAAVSSIAATYTTSDTLAESLWLSLTPTPVAAGSGMPSTAPTYQIAATFTGGGSVNEILHSLLTPVAAGSTAVPVGPTLEVTGTSQDEGKLSGTISSPPGTTTPTQVFSDQLDGDGTFTVILAGLLMPPTPMPIGTPSGLA